MKAFALALVFVVTGFDPVAGVVAGVQAARETTAFQRCVDLAGRQNDWTCE